MNDKRGVLPTDDQLRWREVGRWRQCAEGKSERNKERKKEREKEREKDRERERERKRVETWVQVHA